MCPTKVAQPSFYDATRILLSAKNTTIMTLFCNLFYLAPFHDAFSLCNVSMSCCWCVSWMRSHHVYKQRKTHAVHKTIFDFNIEDDLLFLSSLTYSNQNIQMSTMYISSATRGACEHSSWTENEERKLLNKVVIFTVRSILVASLNYNWLERIDINYKYKSLLYSWYLSGHERCLNVSGPLYLRVREL